MEKITADDLTASVDAALRLDIRLSEAIGYRAARTKSAQRIVHLIKQTRAIREELDNLQNELLEGRSRND